MRKPTDRELETFAEAFTWGMAEADNPTVLPYDGNAEHQAAYIMGRSFVQKHLNSPA